MTFLSPNWGPPLPPYVPDPCQHCGYDVKKAPLYHICPVLWPDGILKDRGRMGVIDRDWIV